ncbi:hypothetical protein R3P38DRAFT_2588336 [Favolaschia claudopus]|uniref:Uncharacterized protein n=1 Tax=Favolaschia claudopus TaxID=2862362 RepID=A0AAV9Z344_9AGAR
MASGPRRSPRKHTQPKKAPKKAPAKKTRGKKQAEPPLPPIDWKADESSLVWALVGRMEVKENRLVLFGKDSTDENTVGDSKVVCYKRMGADIMPEYFATSPNTVGRRIKLKTEWLIRQYKKYSKKLQVTGGGLRKDGDCDETGDTSGGANDGPTDAVHQYLACYISKEGPDHDSDDRAKNIWASIIKKFPFFPALHRFLAARSNIVPPMVTTGVGPAGRKVVHLQPPTQRQVISDDLIDPALRNMTTPRRAKSLPASSPVSISSSEPSPIKRDIKPVGGQTTRLSSFEQGMAKVRSHKPRQTFEESLIGLQREMMVAANAREDVKLQHAREEIRMKEIDQLMKMHSLGLLTTEILGERIKIVNAKYNDPPTPVKRRRSISPVAGSSKRHRYTASSSSFLGSPGSSPQPGSDSNLGSR